MLRNFAMWMVTVSFAALMGCGKSPEVASTPAPAASSAPAAVAESAPASSDAASTEAATEPATPPEEATPAQDAAATDSPPAAAEGAAPEAAAPPADSAPAEAAPATPEGSTPENPPADKPAEGTPAADKPAEGDAPAAADAVNSDPPPPAEFAEGSAERALYVFVIKLNKGDHKELAPLITKKPIGILRSIRDGKLSEKEAENLKNALSNVQLAGPPRVSKGVTMIVLATESGARIQFKLAKEEGKWVVTELNVPKNLPAASASTAAKAQALAPAAVDAAPAAAEGVAAPRTPKRD